ncbi:MAG: amidohydrolase, partial [Promethearchaeota archaeon]
MRDACVVVEGRTVVYAGPKEGSGTHTSGHDRLEYPAGLIAPGFTNAHTHIGETLVRGLCDDLPLHEWLFDNIWRVEPRMTAEDCYWGALLGCAEMMSGGTVGFFDQYFYAGQIARAVDETGLRAYLFPSIFEPTPESETMEDAFRKALATHAEWDGKDGRIRVGFGPHAPYSVDDEWLVRISEKARELGTGVHTHLNETEKEVNEAREKWGCSPVEHCHELGILDEKTLAAHCVHVSGNDLRILRENGVNIVHCPQSNMKLASGVAPVAAMVGEGINVCVGTDGQASNNNLDMLEELTATAMLQKVSGGDPRILDARTTLRLGTQNPAKVFGDGVQGAIREGGPADFAVFDFSGPNATPVIHPLSNLLYSTSSRDVVLTVVAGRILYRDGRYETLDIDEVLSHAQRIAD